MQTPVALGWQHDFWVGRHRSEGVSFTTSVRPNWLSVMTDFVIALSLI